MRSGVPTATPKRGDVGFSSLLGTFESAWRRTCSSVSFLFEVAYALMFLLVMWVVMIGPTQISWELPPAGESRGGETTAEHGVV